MAEITHCDQCDNRTVETAKKHPAQWQCIKFPRLNGYGFLSEKWFDEPYQRCAGINGGACPLFTPIRAAEQIEAERIHRSDFEQPTQGHS